MRLFKNKVSFSDFRGNRVDVSIHPEDGEGMFMIIQSRPRNGDVEFASLDRNDTVEFLGWLMDQVDDLGVSA